MGGTTTPAGGGCGAISTTPVGGGGAVVSPGFGLGVSSDGLIGLCAKSDTCAHVWIGVWWEFGIGTVVQECVE